MTIPPIQKQLAQKQLEKFCAARIPAEVQDRVKMDYIIKGNVATLIEKRPRWDDPAAPWTERPIAHMIFEKTTMTWQLYWIRGNGKKERYTNLPPQKDLQACIDEINADPLGTFWG